MDIIDLSRYIGNYDPSKLVEFVKSLSEADWDEFTDRQILFKEHARTKTIPAIFPDRSNFPEIDLLTYNHTSQICKLCEDICNAFCSYYQLSFNITTAIIVKLEPHSNILEHTDTHPYFGLSHRVHWCLDGDYDNIEFNISGEKIPMKHGDLIEINNRMPHYVLYNGDIPRYDLIIDFMPSTNTGDM